MKILLYIPIEDAVKGKIDPNNYSLHTNINNINDLVQVSITSDEFAGLQDFECCDENNPCSCKPEPNELETRIHSESQSLTGGEFSNWYNNLTAEEKAAYRNVYGH
jgi:hypothetical protein